jgi:3-oxoacid CoA-transferase B subunit
MDLVSSGSKVVIVMEHCAKNGSSKVLKKCSIPLTGKGVVSRLITDLAVFDFNKDGMELIEIAPDITLQELKEKTDAEFTISPNLKKMNIQV